MFQLGHISFFLCIICNHLPCSECNVLFLDLNIDQKVDYDFFRHGDFS